MSLVAPHGRMPLVGKDGSLTVVWAQFITRVVGLLRTAEVTSSVLRESGATADRPTTDLWIGRPYFDTDLGYPVWVQSVGPTVWADASGVPS